MASIHDLEKRRFIEMELARVPGAIFESEAVKICCPFHDDTNPSLGVSLIRGDKFGIGTFNCWSCREGHGGWNKLAEKLGLALWDEKTKEAIETNLETNKFLGLVNLLQNKSMFPEMSKGYIKPVTEGPWEGPWRGIPGSFLRSLGIERLWDDRYSEYRLYIPFTDINGNLIGHVAARGDDSRIPKEYKYLNSEDFPSTEGWLFLNLEKNPEWVVIVEGPFDAIRLRYYGIPAIPLVGVKTFFADKVTGTSAKIGKLLAKGVKNAVILLDADRAGDEMAPPLYQTLTHYQINAVQMDLKRYRINPLDDEEKVDPGECSLQAIKDLQNFLGIEWDWGH